MAEINKDMLIQLVQRGINKTILDAFRKIHDNIKPLITSQPFEQVYSQILEPMIDIAFVEAKKDAENYIQNIPAEKRGD